MRKRLVLVGVGALAVAGAVAVRGSYRGVRSASAVRADQPAKPAAVTTPMARGFVGVVLAGDTVAIEAYMAGRIEKVFVKVGDVVARGDRVARLDSRIMRQVLAEAKVTRAAARARLLRRARLARGPVPAVTAEELDSARFDAAREGAKLAGVAHDLSEATIIAPCAGTVSEQYLYEGAVAGPGRPIVRIVSEGKPRVRFAVPAEEAGGVTPRSSVEVALPNAAGRIRANVVSVSPQVDVYSGMVYALAMIAETKSPDMSHGLSTGGVLVRVFPHRETKGSGQTLEE